MTTTKKFKLSNSDIIVFEGKTLYRIEAMKAFGDVKVGDKGGYIEYEGTLSQDGNSWIYDSVKAFDGARITGNAKIYGNCILRNCLVKDNAIVKGNVSVHGYAEIDGNSIVEGNVSIGGNCYLWENCHILDSARIVDCELSGKVIIGKNAIVENSKIYDSVLITDDAMIKENNFFYLRNVKPFNTALVVYHTQEGKVLCRFANRVLVLGDFLEMIEKEYMHLNKKYFKNLLFLLSTVTRWDRDEK